VIGEREKIRFKTDIKRWVLWLKYNECKKNKRRKRTKRKVRENKKYLKETNKKLQKETVSSSLLERKAVEYLLQSNLFYCCAGWGYIVAFTKVLTMYHN
jgi:hypothetical protein